MPPIIRKFYLLIILMSISGPASAKKTPKPDLLIKEAFNVPLEQVSALGIYEELNSQNFAVFAIGDQASEVRILRWEDKQRQSIQEQFSFAEVMLDRFSPCLDFMSKWCGLQSKNLNSDWEALQVDGQGQRFLLQEQSGLVLALTKTNEYLADFRLDYRPIYQTWEKKTNLKARRKAMGEGLVLMSQGHFLMLHQFEPTLLVEYGPKGDKALGIHPDNFLARIEAFHLPKGGPRHKYEVLASWDIAGLEDCDLNELVYDSRKAMLLTLSKRCQKVYALDSKISAQKQTAKVLHEWVVPEAIKSIEGLAVLPNGQWLIASDMRDADKDNLHLVAPLIKK